MRDDCTRFEAEISALLDGELPAPEAAAAEAHVRACPACAVLARDLAAVGRTLRSTESAAPPVPVSPAFRARILASVGAPRRAPRDVSPPPVPAGRLLPFLPALSAAAAAFAAVIAGGAYLGHRLVPVSVSVPVSTGSPAADRPATASALLLEAEAHRAAGRADLERRALVAALGLAPADPAVRASFARSFGFDPEAAPGVPAAPEPTGPVAAAVEVETDGAVQELWIGSWRFESLAAYDACTSFRERSRGLEMEVAARSEVPAAGPRTVATARAAPAAPDPLARALSSLVVGPSAGGDGSATYQGITVFPLRLADGAPPAPADAAPQSLSAALEAGRAVAKDAPGRSLATILVSNLDPDRSLLVLAGEVLEGGRADRLVARDVLVAPGARNVPIPVYEAEAGSGPARSYGTRFRTVAGVAGSRVRSLALGQARPEDLKAFLRERLDLLDITSKRHRSLADAWSERGAAAPVLRTIRPRLQEALRALQGPGVVGFAVAQGRDVLAIEVFGSHELMIREARRILEGCALEASTYPGGGRPPSTADVAALLSAAGRGTAIRTGEGNPGEVGFVAAGGVLLGSGVARGESVVHASVLPGSPGGSRGPRGGKPGEAPEAGDQPSAGSGSGEGVPAPGSGATPEGGLGAPPPSSGGSGDGKPSDPPPPPGERPR